MEPVSAMLAALQLANSLSGNANAAQSASDNLAFQKQRAAQSDRMSGATKVDAYGNKQTYDPATNTWSTELTPMQQAIQKAGESEQYKTLGEDATRKRQLAQRNEQHSLDAETPYNKAFQEFQYKQPASEDAINNELQSLMIAANQSKGKENQAMVTRQALRLGHGGDATSIIKATNDQLGASTPDVMLKARQQALAEHTGRVQAHDQQYLPEMAAFKQIIDGGGGGASARFSELPSQVAASQTASQNAMLTALNAASGGINNASNSLVRAEGKTADFSSLIKALSAQNKGKTANTNGTGKGADPIDAQASSNYPLDFSNYPSNDYIF